jgi:hypothetical protein
MQMKQTCRPLLQGMPRQNTEQEQARFAAFRHPSTRYIRTHARRHTGACALTHTTYKLMLAQEGVFCYTV